MSFCKKTNTYTFKFYLDDGHAWMAVKEKIAFEFLDRNQISPYSYHKGTTLYLEEDRDMHLLLSKIQNAGYRWSLKEVIHPGKSFIRDYPRYNGGTSPTSNQE
jgi:hypothetical protein